MDKRTIRIVRGKLANEFWGYDVLDSHRKAPVTHVGSLVEAESFAEGYAAGLHHEGGGDVEIRIGPEGGSTRKALLEPGLRGPDYRTVEGPDGELRPVDLYSGEELEL